MEENAVAKTKYGINEGESVFTLSGDKKQVKKINVLNCQIGGNE